MVDHDYRVAKGPANRAIAGLSMGGVQALSVGLNNPGMFCAIGSFSAGLDGTTPGPVSEAWQGSSARNFKRLTITCGVDDPYFAVNRDFVALLQGKGVKLKLNETVGSHTYAVWRRNLIDFVSGLW